MKSPYEKYPQEAFWRSGVAESSPFNINGIYKKKWQINPNWNIATAGSCFAQHVAHNLKATGFNVIDMEPPPPGLPSNIHKSYGYSMYSCRYGNIYTVHQLLQLAQEANGDYKPEDIYWEKGDRYFDALRPAVEPDGLQSIDELVVHRKMHLEHVLKMLQTMDLLVFTLGLTEAWVHIESGTIYPTAPGTIAGVFDENIYTFKNFSFQEIYHAFNEFQKLLVKLRPSGSLPKILLTVSPVPLTATASGHHVLSATSNSKSILRAVAGQLSDENDHIDYFPSFEIITNPAARGSFYENNLRSVRKEGVDIVMNTFFEEHQTPRNAMATVSPSSNTSSEEDAQCEDALLEAFGNGKK